MNENEQALFKNIFNTTKNIENIYIKLYELELNGQKDSKDYQKYLGYLKMFIDIENEYYSNINMDFDDILDIIGCILSITNINSDIFMNNEIIFKQEYENRIAIRICKKLFEILQKYPDKILNVSSFDSIVLERMGGYDNANKINKSFKNDTLLGFVFFINENINDKKQSNSVKSELIKAKYNTLFINSDLENKALSNNFDILELNEEFKIDPSSFGINQSDYEEYRFGSIVGDADEEVDNLLNTNDIDYSNINNVISSILRICFIRASLSLLDSYDYELFKNAFQGYIETRNDDNNISKQLIENCLNSYSKDKAIKMDLTLN